MVSLPAHARQFIWCVMLTKSSVQLIVNVCCEVHWMKLELAMQCKVLSMTWFIWHAMPKRVLISCNVCLLSVTLVHSYKILYQYSVQSTRDKVTHSTVYSGALWSIVNYEWPHVEPYLCRHQPTSPFTLTIIVPNTHGLPSPHLSSHLTSTPTLPTSLFPSHIYTHPPSLLTSPPHVSLPISHRHPPSLPPHFLSPCRSSYVTSTRTLPPSSYPPPLPTYHISLLLRNEIHLVKETKHFGLARVVENGLQARLVVMHIALNVPALHIKDVD